MNSAELIKPAPNKILTIVRLFTKKSRIWLVASILLLLGISQAFAANPQEVIQLLNQGLGINAKMKALEIFESSKNNEEKNNNIKLLLEVCMITTDNECFAKYWDTNWEGLYSSLNLMPKGTTEEKDRWNMTVDFLTAMYMYRLGFFPTEELVKQQLIYVKDRVTGATQYQYSSLRTVMEARAAASIGDRVLARKLIKRARALVLSRNLNNILEQLTLAYCLETSIYQLFDSQDARRLVKSFGQAGSESGINIEKYINPYVSLRVNRAILESGTQEPSARAVTADYLHVLYQNLQLPQKSTLLAQKESFYAYLALDKSWGNEIALSFDPTTEFEKIIDPVNFDAIGVKAYLQAISSSLDDKNSSKIDEAIKLIEHLRNISDATTKRNFTPTYLILSSLKYRLQGDLQKEKRYLEDWVESQLDYFKFGGFNLLDQPPAMTGLIEKIVRYTVQRLIEIEPNSQALFRLTYFSIVTLNAKKDGDVTTSYALLQASGSDLKDRQIQDRIRLNADYSREITDAYYKSAKHLIENRTNSTFDGGVGRLATYQLLEKFKSSDQQLSEFTNKTNPFVNLDYKTLIPKDPDYSVILFAEADGYLLSLSLMKDSTKVQLLSLSKDPELSDSLSILTSKGLDKIPAEKIKIASVKFSRKIFGGLTVLGSHIQMLTGPTVLSVPYTLLSNPVTGDWLIKQSYVEAYLSPEHRKISEKKLNNIRRTDYVAFANPVLRSKNEFAMVDSIAGMIRGSSGGISSLAELPETEVEAINFAKTFKGKKELYFGKDANIDNLISVNLDNVSVLSFSTHGVLAGEVDGAKSSSIVLSPTKNNNGLIPTDWLFSLTGSPHLAILSTCNSGTSAYPLDSSELTSLASVFLLKGSGAVMSSYWQVDSQGTVEMMGRLSREMTQSSSYSIAFLQAIRGLQADPKWNHPSVWAAFVMIGNHNINIKIAEVDDVIKLDINGSVRDWYKKNNTTVLLGFESGSKDEWKISETTIDLNLKTPVTSIRKDNTYESFIDVQVSKANKFGVIAAIRNTDSWTFSNVTESGDFVKICTLEKVALDWLIGDFFKTKTHIFSLFKRSAEDGVEYGLASISIEDCNPIINAPYHFKTGIKGYANLRLFPISGGEDIVFSTEAPISGKGVIFNGPFSELGVAPSCNFDTVNTYYTLGSDLTQKRSFTFGNIFIDNIRLAGTPIGVIGLDRDPCTKKVTVRFLSDDFFTSKNSLNLEKTIINSNQASIEVSELLSNNFEEIQHLWWEPGAEYLYISGTPIFPARFAKNITEEIIGKDAFSEWLSGLPSVYSYSLRTRKWLKIATAEQCAFPQPLGYDEGSFFMCNDGFKIQNKSIFLKRNF